MTESVFESAETAARWRANAERRARFLAPATERMLDAAGVVAGARVLDLGTGTGDTALLAAQRVGPAGSVLATDVSEAMLRAATEAVAAAGLTNVECQRQDASALVGLEPESFDAVIARFSLQFVPDLGAALAGIRRVLKPGGRFGALVWAAAELNPFLSLSVAVARRTGRLRAPEAQVGRPFSLADAAALAGAARGAGLEAEVEEIPLEVQARDTAGAMEGIHNSPTTNTILDALEAGERKAFESDLVAEIERYREPDGEGYRFPALALLLRGRKGA
ncbi:MAG TPA: class I SAM-dependent methyltransferase [Candidatus Dormibacteraeota bacterium]